MVVLLVVVRPVVLPPGVAAVVVAAVAAAAAAVEVEVVAEVGHTDNEEAVPSVIACNKRHFDTEMSGARELCI